MFQFVDTKRGLILEAALSVFVTYGFRKTSMDDIARQAGVSRPALYQIFKNKTDIFRALSQEMMDRAADAASDAFKTGEKLDVQLFNSIDCSIMEMHRFVEQTPHGVELIGINQEIAQDIEDIWKEKMVSIIGGGITSAVSDNRACLDRFEEAGIDSEAVARIVMEAMEGLRSTYMAGKPIENYVSQLVGFVALSLHNTTNASASVT